MFTTVNYLKQLQEPMLRHKKTIFGTIALILVTFVLMQSCSVDYLSSVIPGWNTILFPKMLFTRIVGLWLVVVLLIYFFLLRKETSSTTAYTYLIMTVPFILCDALLSLSNFFGNILYVCIPLFCIAIISFVVAQIIFVIKLFSYTIKNRSK